jgi:hypothetical protein
LFERCNAIADTSLQLLSFDEWTRALKRLHGAGWSLPVLPLIDIALSVAESPLNECEPSVGSGHIRFDCTRTRRELEQAGIVAPVLNDDLLKTYLQGMFANDPELRNPSAARTV